MKTHLLLSAFVLSLAGTAFAQSASPQGSASMPRVEKRQERQQQRIDQGVASGSLTGKEAQRLQSQQTRIEAAENRAQADGKVTRKERAAMEARQDKASRRIAKQKHDAQTAPAKP